MRNVNLKNSERPGESNMSALSGETAGTEFAQPALRLLLSHRTHWS